MSELTVWWIIAMVGLAAFWWMTDRPAKRMPRAPAPPPAAPPKPKPPPFRVEDLGAYLDEEQRDKEATEQAERARRQQLQARWAGIAPAVAEAVALVNAQLAGHAMELVPKSEPGFRGEEKKPFGFGATYSLERNGLPVFDGEHSFVAGENVLHVANIGEIELPLEELTARKIADTTAESIKWFLEG